MSNNLKSEEFSWEGPCKISEDALFLRFWDSSESLMRQGLPAENPHNRDFCYWWHAHVIDVLADAYLRTGNSRFSDSIAAVLEGVLQKNGGQIPNLYYDDMEWMALALLRAWNATGAERYQTRALELWEDIKTGWNENCGGGISWRKTQLDYKNTPANGPASILASRLYRFFRNPEDKDWARRIYAWNRENLVDPATGFVWDGVNRNGNGKIDKDWVFTYCQGVMIGAGVELYRVTGLQRYLDEAEETFCASLSAIVEPAGGVLPDEGDGDCGLFKGIYIRYLLELYLLRQYKEIENLIFSNAKSLWENGTDHTTGLFSRDWRSVPGETVDLSTQLSGLMLLEAAETLQAGRCSEKA